jgi:protein involved in polysaccharide export with SLBB domain
MLGSGCNLIDVTIARMGRWSDDKEPQHQPILDEIFEGESTTEPANAEDPIADDFRVVVEDYRIGPGDGISVSVPDLLVLGMVYQQVARVSNTGFVTLPSIGRLRVAGLTDRQLENKIATTLKNVQVLEAPQVVVQVIDRRQQTFSMMGAVSRPGTYTLLRSNFTLLDALGLGGSVGGFGIEQMYVIRASERDKEYLVPETEEKEQWFARPRSGAGAFRPGELPTTPDIPGPAVPAPAPAPGPAVPGGAAVPPPGRPALGGTLPGQPVAPPLTSGPAGLVPYDQPATPGTGAKAPAKLEPRPPSPGVHGGKVSWRWDTARGEYVRVGSPAPGVHLQVAATRPVDELTDAEIEAVAGKRRVVRIDLKLLMHGDPKQNIVLRSNDIVYVPQVEVGEYTLAGRVARPGSYPLTGRKLTLKEVIGGGGGVAQLADITRVDIVRRLGPNDEVTVMVNLAEIWEAKAPNFYIKPHDIINVGEDWYNRPLAIFLNAFRMTYGFGFVYDKNYSDED